MTTSQSVPDTSLFSWAKRLAQGQRRMPILPLVIITCIVLTAILADFLTPYSPVDISLSDRLRPPFWQERGSLAHPLGTDPMGRDLLTRMIYGARVSLLVAILSLLAGGGVGAGLGLIAGYYGGRIDGLVMRPWLSRLFCLPSYWWWPWAAIWPPWWSPSPWCCGRVLPG